MSAAAATAAMTATIAMRACVASGHCTVDAGMIVVIVLGAAIAVVATLVVLYLCDRS